MANKKHKKSNNHNMDMLSNVRMSSLRALFPNFDECQLKTNLLTIHLK